MYCIQCGAKLADSQTACPLCGTRVYHPDIVREQSEPLFPVDRHPPQAPRSLAPQFIASFACLLPLVTLLVCDLQISHTVTWSGYVAGAILLGYIALILPSWFRKPNPVIFVPCGFAAATVYLLYISLATNGGWFLSFAFPVAGGIGLLVTTVVTLLYYVKRGALFILGGAFVTLGVFMLPVEFLANYTFDVSHFIGWSLYPLTALVMLGGFLIFLGLYRPAREAMERKFFI